MYLYTITIQSTFSNDYDYVLYEQLLVDDDEIINWLFNKSSVSEALHPFLVINAFHITYTFTQTVCTVHLRLNEIETINVIDSVNAVRYIIPYHASLQHVHYFRYFSMLYTCEHANEISEFLPEHTLSDWVYAEMVESPFELIYKEHQDNIYSGTCLVMMPSVHIIPEQFMYTLIQQMG